MKKIFVTFLFLHLMFFFQVKAQVYLSENFNNGFPDGWITVDRDGDGKNWAVEDYSYFQPWFGKGSIVSYSWLDDSLKPDNFIISRVIDLTGTNASELKLTYDEFSNVDFPGDHYAVYITTSNNIDSILASSPLFEVSLNGGFYQRSFDITQYAGKHIYVTFRHFQSSGIDVVVVDNLLISSVMPYDVDLYKSTLDLFGELKSKHPIEMNIKNKGVLPISSLEVTWNDGNAHVATIPVDIQPGKTVTLIHPDSVFSDILETKNIKLTITKVNNQNDLDTTNNSNNFTYFTFDKKGTKRVLVEEGTGTWCGYCVRGIVALDLMTKKYPETFLPIAIHGGDIMEVPGYPQGAAFYGYPSIHVDRAWKNIDISPNNIDSVYQKRIETTHAPIDIEVMGTINGNTITITPKATFYINNPQSNFRFVVIMTENNVHDSINSEYAQINNYSGGALGIMGGFENKPGVISPQNMYYQHVARAMLGGYYGQENSVPMNIQNNSVAEYTFSYMVPEGRNPENYTAIAFVVETTTGEVLNSCHLLCNTLGKPENSKNTVNLSVFPNPADQNINIKCDVKGECMVQIFSQIGMLIKSEKHTFEIDNQIITIPTNDIKSGSYLISLSQNGYSISKNIIILH